jgi:outer membrane protein TolC
MAGLEAQKAVLDVEMAQRERLPAVSFSGDAGVLSSLDNLRLPPGERVTGLGYSIGVLVELPLFTWGSIGLRVEQRQLAAESQRLRLEQLKRRLRTEVNGVRAQMQTARSALRTLKGTLRSAEDAYLLTKSKFAGGGTLSIEVLSAQQLLADTRTARLHSLAEWHTLKARLAQLTAQ